MTRAILHSLITSLLVLILASCGGGGSAGIGGTGITSGGTITGFGSIFVNGIEYDTNSAIVSGDLANVSDLKLGMVVTVRGELNNDNVTGKADTIDVDIELKGAVTTAPVLDPANVTKSFSVLGRSVIVSDSETVFDGANFNFDNIAINDVVEVSGYLDTSGSLQASRIEKKGTLDLGTTEVEVNGIYVQPLSAVSFELMVAGNTLVINNPNNLIVPGGFSNGQRLEVKGIQTTNTEISATEIEIDEDAISDSDSADKIEIEGLVTNYNGPGDFSVHGQQVDASTAIKIPANLVLGNNVRVEIEGRLVNSVLIADTIEARSGEIEVQANVSSVDVAAKTITLSVSGQTITINLNSKSELEDEEFEVEPFTIADISSGDFLIIKAYDDSGNYVATDIKRKEDSTSTKIKLVGTVTAFDPNTPSVSLLGITYPTDNMTSFEINGSSKTSAEFFATLQIGDKVELEDQKANGTGVADKIELDS